MKYVVSGCLAGLPCRYDGGSKPCEAVRRLVEEGRAVTACPESLSGLPVPAWWAHILKFLPGGGLMYGA